MTDPVHPGSGRLATFVELVEHGVIHRATLRSGRWAPWAGSPKTVGSPGGESAHRTTPEKTLWRMLYETAARASEILSLDVADLDLANRRPRLRSKAARPGVFWQTGTTAVATPTELIITAFARRHRRLRWSSYWPPAPIARRPARRC
jgi:integrase